MPKLTPLITNYPTTKPFNHARDNLIKLLENPGLLNGMKLADIYGKITYTVVRQSAW
jgi:hypothetical protein